MRSGEHNALPCDAGFAIKRPRPFRPRRVYWAQQPRHGPAPHVGPVVHCGIGIPRAPTAGTTSSSQTFWSQRVRSDVIITRHGDEVARCLGIESIAHFARACMGTKVSTSTQCAPALYVHQTGGLYACVCAREVHYSLGTEALAMAALHVHVAWLRVPCL